MTAETTNQRRDGTRFPVRVIAAPGPTDASHMIVTVENITAEKQRRSEAEAIDAERRRIAHEIHDGLAQNLAGVRFKSALWHQRADAAPMDAVGGVTVSVRDKGRGFDPSKHGPADHAGHFGLRQMRERILDHRGTLDIRSAIGQGTELVINLPPAAKEVNHAFD